jgi:urease accessory protein
VKLNSFLSLLQISDSALPIGAYSHSFGFETLVQEGELNDAFTVERSLKAFLRAQILPTEAAAASLGFRAQKCADLDLFKRLNERLTAMRWTPETLQASLSLGKRLNELAGKLSINLDLPEMELHHCALFGWLSACLDAELEFAAAAYVQSSIFSLVSACVRLIPLGHTEGQRIIASLRAEISRELSSYLSLELEELGGFAPLAEFASVKHEQLYSRLCQS